MTLYRKIVLMATNVVNNVEKYQELPVEKGYNWRQYTDLFAKSVLNPYKNITSRKVGKAPNQKGTSIQADISKADYIQLAKNLQTLIDKYGYLPNYLKYGNYKIRPVLYCYMFAKIVVYMSTHKNYPSYCPIDSEVFRKKNYKKYGRSTEYGCDNRGQNNGYYCGPHMVQEIIRNLTGKLISQSTLAEVIGTTSDGSDHDGINTSFAWFNRKYGYNLEVEWKHFSDVGWGGIKQILESSNQDCGIHELYRDKWGHYTNFDKVYSGYVDVHNSLGDYCSSGCYCGYTEERNLSTAKNYIGGISQKSVIIVTNK